MVPSANFLPAPCRSGPEWI